MSVMTKSDKEAKCEYIFVINMTLITLLFLDNWWVYFEWYFSMSTLSLTPVNKK